MNDWLPILRRARTPLLVLAGTAVLGAALFFGSRHVLDQLEQGLAEAQAQSGVQQAALAEKERDLAGTEANLGLFRTLQQQGLVGIAEREAWVEQLLASRRDLGLPETLTYTLKPPAPLGTDPAAATSAAPTPAAADAPMAHDLEFEIRDIHEAELLALLDTYRAKVRGRFRTQSCRLSEPAPSGLAARCVLRFFTLAPVAPKPVAP